MPNMFREEQGQYAWNKKTAKGKKAVRDEVKVMRELKQGLREHYKDFGFYYEQDEKLLEHLG